MPIVTDARRQSTTPLVPASGRGHTVDGHKPRVGRGHRMRTITLVLAIAGSIIIPGIGTPLIPGGLISVGSAVTTVAAPTGPALSFRPMGNCPGGSVPCP